MMSVVLVGIGCIVYAYVLLLRLPVGLPRLVAFLPWLPILLHSACSVPGVHLGGLVSFFFLWMIPFKMLLLCWNAGHARDPCLTTSFLRFLAAMGLSIHIPPPGKQQGLRDESEAELAWWEWIEGSLAWQAVVVRAVLKLGMVVLLFEWVYAYRGRGMPEIALYLAYSVHVYLACSLAFELLAAGAAACLGVRLEPQFDKPFLATSLADFWGRRWNRLVSSVLRAAVYEPLLAMMCRRGGDKVAVRMNKVVATLGTFLVSGLMHELIFLVINSSTHPTWQVTAFFLVQGVATVLENRVITRSSTSSTWWRRVLTLGFIFATARCLFFPPIHNTGTCDKALSEFEHFLGFFRSSF